MLRIRSAGLPGGTSSAPVGRLRATNFGVDRPRRGPHSPAARGRRTRSRSTGELRHSGLGRRVRTLGEKARDSQIDPIVTMFPGSPARRAGIASRQWTKTLRTFVIINRSHGHRSWRPRSLFRGTARRHSRGCRDRRRALVPPQPSRGVVLVSAASPSTAAKRSVSRGIGVDVAPDGDRGAARAQPVDDLGADASGLRCRSRSRTLPANSPCSSTPTASPLILNRFHRTLRSTASIDRFHPCRLRPKAEACPSRNQATLRPLAEQTIFTSSSIARPTTRSSSLSVRGSSAEGFAR